MMAPMIEETRPMTPLPGRIQKSPKPMAAPRTNAPRSHQTSFGSPLRAILNVSTNCWRRFILGCSGVLAM